MKGPQWEGSKQLRNKSVEEVENLAQRGREMLERDRLVPEDTAESHAIARVLRKSGVFGLAAARAGSGESNDSSEETADARTAKRGSRSRPIRRDVRVDHYDHL